MTAADLTTTLDHSGWQLAAATSAPSRGRAFRDLKADWRRWSSGERTAVLVIAVLWAAAFLTVAVLGGA